MDPMKNRGSSKFFACFKPIDDNAYCNLASPPSSGDESSGGRRRKILRSFSSSFKNVVGKMSKLKKSRSEISKQDFRNLSSKSKKFLKYMKKNLSCHGFWETEEIFRTNSNSSSLFSSNLNSRHRTTSSSSSSSSSSCPSSVHSKSRSSGSERIKRSVSLDFRQMSPGNRQESMKRSSDCGRKCINYNPNLEMSIFFVCLVCLVFWGKVFAIMTCTSTWLLFAPGRRGHRVELSVSEYVGDSEDYKKRVIMAGLLERNRRRLL